MTVDLSNSYQLTYAGICFVTDKSQVVQMRFEHDEMVDEEARAPKDQQVLPDLISEINRIIPLEYLQDFSLPNTFPGRNLSAIAQEPQIDPQPNPDIGIGDFYY